MAPSASAPMAVNGRPVPSIVGTDGPAAGTPVPLILARGETQRGRAATSPVQKPRAEVVTASIVMRSLTAGSPPPRAAAASGRRPRTKKRLGLGPNPAQRLHAPWAQ